MPERGPGRFVPLVSLYALAVAAYFVLRYHGGWLEGDTARLIESTSAVLSEGTLVPKSNAYGFGFNYPTLASFLALVTGTPVIPLLTLVRPFFVVMVGAAAFALYAQILPGRGLAAVAAIVLLLQPEFLFVNLRGSHEAVTWLLLLMALYLLIKGVRGGIAWVSLAKYAAAFYLVVFALVTTSYFFASSFIFGLSLSFGGGMLLTAIARHAAPRRSALVRFAYIASACAILVYLLVFSLYAPAQRPLQDIVRSVDRAAAFLGSFDVAANPYLATAGRLWTSPYMYLGLTLGNWLTLGASAVMWLVEAWTFWRSPEAPELVRLVPWLFYAAFALQVAISIILDLSGALSSNLQLRLFPAVIIVGVPYAILFVLRLFRAGRRRLPRQARVMAALLGLLLLAWLSAASLLKSTTDPLVSNKWSFFSSSEEAGLEWAQTHARAPSLWVGLDERLRELGILLEGADVERYYDLYLLAPETTDVLHSDIMEMRKARLRIGLPDVGDAHTVYDNGSSQLFHLRPKTPFQR